MPRTLAIMTTDASRRVLDFAHQLLGRPASEQPAIESLLEELAGAIGAPACGLVGLPDGGHAFRYPAAPSAPASPWPWADDPSLLDRASLPPGAVVVEREGQPTMLVTPLTGPASFWAMYVEDEREFSESEQAAFALAGNAVARWLAAGSQARWADQIDRAARQHQLETSAAVTRRLAHDFGNVLTGILGFTELALGQQIPTNTSLYSYLNEVYRAAQTGAQFTHQLRLFSRRQSATSRSSQLSVSLAEQEARLFASRDPGMTFRLHVPADLPPVALDGEHLGQVLGALLDNAREALVGPGSISVSAQTIEVSDADARQLYGNVRPGSHVEVTIADTGMGMSPEVQRRLFAEPFFTTKPRRRGFGLATAYGVLHAHKGGLRLYPGAEGGVVARLLLPIAPAAYQPDQLVRPSDKVRGERILLADDEPEVLQFIGTTLEQAGYRVEPHAGGHAALEAYFGASSDPFQLVLTDVVMPGLNGLELVRRLLKRDPAVRVLFLSGHVPSDFMQHDFAGHGFELLPKPFRTEQLLRAVRAALDRSERKKLKAEG